MYPISAGIADTFIGTPEPGALVSQQIRIRKSHPEAASAQAISPMAMMTVPGPAVVMAASTAPSIMMAATAMAAHMTVTVAVSALHLDHGIARKDARRNSRHRQRRCRRGEDGCCNKARLNKTFHFWNLLHRAVRR